MAYYTPGGAIHFEQQDWLGTERLRTAYNGGVEGSFTSLPWGDGYTASGADTDANHFATLDHDAETDTEHAGARQYENAQGRWLSPDPYSGSYDPSNPQSFNRYAYVMNSPMSNVDPSGLASITVNVGTDCFVTITYEATYSYIQDFTKDIITPITSNVRIIDVQTTCYPINANININTGSGTNNGTSNAKAPNNPTSVASLLQCASKTANQFSLAGILGLTNSNSVGATIGTAFLGNTFSGIVDTGTHIVTGHFGAAYGDIALSGTSLGLPIGNSISARGIVTPATEAAVGTTLGAEMVEPVGWAKLGVDGLVFIGSAINCYAKQ